ncbi:MAG: nucleoside deaminase, partial [Saprospiraceae bacterium]|nr:nucleoside deaminase [Saprospiraceae bacterium]
MEDEKKKFMLSAIKIAEENVLSQNGGPFGAVIVKDGKIIGKGANSVTSSNDPTAHAEINAIRNACKNINSFILNDCEIYSSCEPCPMCLSAIYCSKINKIYYAGTQSDAENAGF